MSDLTSAYKDFCALFPKGDGYKSESVAVHLTDLFASQRVLDKAKKELGKEGFNSLLHSYFSQYIKNDKLETKALSAKVAASEPIFHRHLGKDKLFCLKLIIKLSEPKLPRQGLLVA